MIHFKQGSIFDSTCQVLTVPVNCEGIVGKGLAYEFQKRFYYFLKQYKKICMDENFRPGKLGIIRSLAEASYPSLLLFPTTIYWSHPSKIEYIEKGLQALTHACLREESFCAPSLAIPALGCGLGRLAWKDVKQTLLQYLPLLIHTSIEVYEPKNSYASTRFF